MSDRKRNAAEARALDAVLRDAGPASHVHASHRGLAYGVVILLGLALGLVLGLVAALYLGLIMLC